MGRVAAGLAGSAVGAVGALAWPYAVDDAYVLARYAARIAGGAGYTFIDGPPTDGVTGPLGLIPAIASAAWLGDPLVGAKVAGLAAAVGATVWVVLAAGRESRHHGVVTGLLLSLWPLLGIWAVAGLETGLATLACTALGWGLVRRQPWVLGLGIASLAWLRPEASLAALLALVVFSSRRGLRASLPAWGLAGASAIGVVVFRLATFGALLPMSAAAKPPDLAHGLDYAARALVIVWGVFGLVPVWLAARSPDAASVLPRRELVLLLLAHVVAVVLAGGDWMPGFRLFVPWLPIAAWVAAGPIASALHDHRRLVAAALLAGSVAIPAFAGTWAVVEARAAGEARETVGREIADWLRVNGERVALVDVGFLAFESGLDVVDLGGITDPSIARLPGGHVDKRIDSGILYERAPDLIVLHSSVQPTVDDAGRLRAFAGHPVERRVSEMGWVRAGWRVARVVRYSPSTWYILLTPR